MSPVAKVILWTSLLAAAFLTTTYLHRLSWVEQVSLVGPYSAGQGFLYQTELPIEVSWYATVPTNTISEYNSSLKLFWNGRELPRSSGGTQSIIDKGDGLYVHWYNQLQFSLPGNINPNEALGTVSITYSKKLAFAMIAFCWLVVASLYIYLIAYCASHLLGRNNTAPGSGVRQNLRFWLVPFSLVSAFLGSVLYYLDDNSVEYQRLTEVGILSYYERSEFDETFDNAKVTAATHVWDGRVGVEAPWWTAQIESGQSIILRDSSIDLTQLPSGGFVGVFGRMVSGEGASELIIGRDLLSIEAASSPSWHKISLTSHREHTAGEVEILFRSEDSTSKFEFWGVLSGIEDTRPRTWQEPLLLTKDRKIQKFIRDPAPIRGGAVSENEFKIISNLSRAPDADAVWSVGVDKNLPLSNKAVGLFLLLTSLVVGGSLFLRSLSPILLSSGKSGFFLCTAILLATSIHWYSDEQVELNRNKYVDQTLAQSILETDGKKLDDLLRQKFDPLPEIVVEELPSLEGLFDEEAPYYVPWRQLGDYGVSSDSMGYIGFSWQILNGKRPTYLAAPIGWPVFAAAMSDIFGFSTKNLSTILTAIYLAAGLLTAYAVLNFSNSVLAAGITILIWAMYEDAANYSKIMFTEGLAIATTALFLAIFSVFLNKRNKEKEHLDLPMVLSIGVVIVFTIYIRDVFLAYSLFLLLFFVALWNRKMETRLIGVLLISLIVAGSWVFVPLLHIDRSVEEGLVGLLPISSIRVASLSQQAADFINSSRSENLHPQFGIVYTFLNHSASVFTNIFSFLQHTTSEYFRFWFQDWYWRSGPPYYHTIIFWAGRYTGDLLVITASLSSIACGVFFVTSSNRDQQQELKLAISIAALLFVFALFHVLSPFYFGGRARISFAPILLTCAIISSHVSIREFVKLSTAPLSRSSN